MNMLDGGYCTLFPERFRGDEISGACENHDYDVTHYYNPYIPANNFWYNLRNCGVSFGWRVMIVTGATVGVMVRYPWFVYKVYKNRKAMVK
jgi:hypothetical protein